MKLSILNKLLEQLVPSCFAEAWDNVGLISGDPQQKVTRILLAVDLTPGVLAEAGADDPAAPSANTAKDQQTDKQH